MIIRAAKFDKEYATQWKKEVNFLKERGINYTYMKLLSGIETYKYTKNEKLFSALTLFYKMIEQKGE